MRSIISVIGDSKTEDEKKLYLAYDIGKSLIDNGYRVMTGGLGGVMKATFEGCKSSLNYKDGDTISILPSCNPCSGEVADIVIPTGLDVGRNMIISNSSAVIAIGGGAGTLSEIAMAWSYFKLIIAYANVDGWSRKVGGTKLDNRVRYTDIDEDSVFSACSSAEVINLLRRYLDRYNRCHNGIK